MIAVVGENSSLGEGCLLAVDDTESPNFLMVVGNGCCRNVEAERSRHLLGRVSHSFMSHASCGICG